MITIKQVSKTFLQGTQQVHALNEVDLHVPKGKIFGVIGASGAGKSTLIRMVNLLERPTRGQVFVDGIDLTALSRTDLGKMRQKIGMIFQHFNLLSSRTVFDNVAFPLELAKLPRAEINTRVTELLALVGLSDKHQSYPNKLSGGQKQRVAIARALAGAPKVLLCDEATSALDPATTHSILTLLQKINQQLGITILLITHEMDVIKRICHDLAVISGGKLIETGSVADIFANPQTELAQSFIRSTQHLTIPPEYADKLQPQNSGNLAPLVRIDFTGASVDAPIISQISRQFNIDVSILSSDIDYAGGVKFGHMLAEIFGQPDQIEQALAFLQQHHIDTEVLGYVA